MTEQDQPPNALAGVVTVTGELDVVRHPDCPVCGEEGCETNHMREATQ